jgi:uncharacterized protein YoxC
MFGLKKNDSYVLDKLGKLESRIDKVQYNEILVIRNQLANAVDIIKKEIENIIKNVNNIGDANQTVFNGLHNVVTRIDSQEIGVQSVYEKLLWESKSIKSKPRKLNKA